MFIFKDYWISILMMATIIAIPMRSFAASPTVIFSEIAWAGSSYSSSDEWIELTNVSNETIDISGWTVMGASGDNAIEIPDQTQLQSYSTYTIANYVTPHENSALALEPDYTTASLSLPNSGFSLYLYDNDGTQIDVAGDGGTPFAGGSGGTAESTDGRYRSMVRADELTAGDIETAWVDAQSADGFISGASEYGTPGVLESWFVVSQETPEESVGLLINEFVSDPKEDQQEWIEIVNASKSNISTEGFTLEDATGKQTAITSTDLAPGAFIVIENPAGKLNNGGDTIVLRDAEGNMLDEVIYGSEDVPAADDPNSVARNDQGEFHVTGTPTPGDANVFTEAQDEIVEDTQEEIAEVEEEVDAQKDAQDTTESEPEQSEGANDEIVEETTEPASFPSGTFLINEFVSDPLEGEKEWIELVNTSAETVNVEGWTIEDNTGRQTELPFSDIAPGGFRIIVKPKGILNNGGDTIILKDPTGNIIDELTYGTDAVAAPEEGAALARDVHGTMQITNTPTPGSDNVLQDQDEVVEKMVVEETVNEGVTETVETEIASSPTTLAFSEFYINTAGPDVDEEFIELENTGLESIDLTGWTIEDGATDRFTFENGQIEPGKFVAFMRATTKIALNNAGDTLQLFAPDGALINQVTYGQAKINATYARVGNIWGWSGDISPNESNQFTTILVASTTNVTSVITGTVSASATTHEVTIKEAKQFEDGARVAIEGVVTVTPGVFGKQIFYIQDDTGGIQIYHYDAVFPETNVGEMVVVEGILSTYRGERRVKIAETGDMSVKDTIDAVSAQNITIEGVQNDEIGSLVKITGIVLSRDGNKVTIEDQGNSMTVYLNTTPAINSTLFSYGAKVSVTGVMSSYNETFRLRPRSNDDLEIIEEPQVSATTITSKSNYENGQGQLGLIVLLTTLLMLGLLALWRHLPRRTATAV